MPVPVRTLPNQTAHSTHKPLKAGDPLKIPSSSLRHSERSLSLSPGDLLPPFSGREQWVHHPSWSRTKTRRSWEVDSSPAIITEGQERGFRKGLAAAIGASAIKGEHVETCIPPLVFSQARGFGMASPVDHQSRTPGSDLHQGGLQDTRPLCGRPPSTSPIVAMEQDPVEYRASDVTRCLRASPIEDDTSSFAPILEDDSPGLTSGDMGSSPIEPLTPFGDYVDRAVASSDPSLTYDPLAARSQVYTFPYPRHCGSQGRPNCCHPHPYPRADVKEELPTTASEPPTATFTYRKLAEPMAEWIVSYVWKVCTNAIFPPETIARYTSPHAAQLRHPAPLHLARLVHSLLMSTLLQPSAILLALWYIVRLPVYFGAAGLGLEHVKERRFRAELLGDNRNNVNGETVESAATFRLIVLGCMLANKWLDDHTFSNKTWHTVSNVPVQSLNKLEYLALDILAHDLSVSPSAWSTWLNHLHSYHQSMAMVKHPQPISRPSSNPHTIILKTIQEIMEAPLAYLSDEPVFLGVEQRIREKFGLASTSGQYESFEIDLDEDGPLREEYLPKRNTSNAISIVCSHSEVRTVPRVEDVPSQRSHPVLYQHPNVAMPSVEWVPTGDEPVNQQPHRLDALYIPVQPSFAPQYAAPAPAMYHGWPAATVAYLPVRQHPDRRFVGNMLPIPQYHQWHHVNGVRDAQLESYYDSNYFMSHSRTNSQDVDFRCHDVRVTSDGTGYRPHLTWTLPEPCNLLAPRFGCNLPSNYQTTCPRS